MALLGRRGRAPGLGAGSEEGTGVEASTAEPHSPSRLGESHPNIHIPWCPGNGSAILLPMGKRDRQGRSGVMRLLFLMPSPPVLSGGGWELAQTCIGREQYVTTTGAGLRLPNSQPAWGDNI